VTPAFGFWSRFCVFAAMAFRPPEIMDITKVPFNQFIGLERSLREGFLFRLPAGDQYTNHLGTVHAGALMALAEATSGEILLRSVGSWDPAWVPVVRRFECKFRKPATGAIDARGEIPESGVGQLLADLGTRRRASIDIPVEIYDGAGVHCCSASVEWFIAAS
jgi:acyl-coenzyme A thioesterase PaaI-like protein